MDWVFACLVPGFFAAYMVRKRTNPLPERDICPTPPCPPLYLVIGAAGGALFKLLFPYGDVFGTLELIGATLTGVALAGFIASLQTHMRKTVQ